MRWIDRLLGSIRGTEGEGIWLDISKSHWEMDGPETFSDLFKALQDWLPEGAILYFEGGYPDAEISNFLNTQSIPEQARVAKGTIWPNPRTFHIPATKSVLVELALIMDHHAEPELAVHFHVYRDNTVLIEWHDAFAQPMLLSGLISEEQIGVLAGKFGKKFRRIVSQ
jgi:hypothetical protein